MGLKYSFEFITKSENLLMLIKAFSKKLSQKDRNRFINVDKYEPEYEDLITDSWENISAIKMGLNLSDIEKHESKNHYCFSLLPKADKVIDQYFSSQGAPPNIEDGQFPVGCAWTSLYVDRENVLLTITAATSDMSRLFDNSKSIHKLCSDIAKEVGNISVFLDKEDQLYWWQIYPERKKYIKPDQDLFSSYQKISIINVDAYVMEAERLADKNLC